MNFKNQISSQMDKIKSLEEQLIEFKTEVKKLTSAELVVEPNSKEKDFYIPPFRVCLDRTYFAETENLLLKSL